jgi:hypothetical protein
MVVLFKVLVFYFVLAVGAVGLVWFSIGQKGFVGLEDTDSPLAKLFRSQRVKLPEPANLPKKV